MKKTLLMLGGFCLFLSGAFFDSILTYAQRACNDYSLVSTDAISQCGLLMMLFCVIGIFLIAKGCE